MKDYLPFIVVGVTSGSLYGLAAMGLVLTFRTSGVFNFAHGAIAAAAAYLFYDLRFSAHLPWFAALVLTVGIMAAISGVLLERLNRSLANARPVMSILATVGLLLAISGFITWHYGPTTQAFPPFLPTSGVKVAGVLVQYSQMITIGLGAALAAGMYWFVQRTQLGAAMRGVVDDPALLALTSRRPSTVRAIAWSIGSGFASLSGVLLATTLGRDAFLLTLLVVQAFGAAAIGRFQNLPWTYAGGVITGVLTALITKEVTVSTNSVLQGLPTATPFLILFGVLVFLPHGRLPAQRAAGKRAPVRAPGSGRRNRIAALAVLAAALAVPSTVGAKLPVFTNGLVFVVIFMSLGLLIWTSGQLSLCHATFVAVGATTFSHLTVGAGLPWGLALLLAGLAAAPVGAVIALPAVKLSGIYLALATFGFGILMQRALFTTGMMFGSGATGQTRTAPRPDIPGFGGQSDTEFYFVVLAVALLAGLLLLAVLRSRLGRILRALADSPAALTVHGLTTSNTRLLVFSLSAFVAGIGGSLMVAMFGAVRPGSFGPFESLTWLAVLALSGTAVFRSALVAAVVFTVVPSYAPSGFVEYQTMLFGLAAIAVAVLSGRSFEPKVTARMLDRIDLSPVRYRRTETAARAPAVAGAGEMR